jgi:tight adherence protein C
MNIFLYIAVSFTFCCIALLLAAPLLLRPSRGARRILEVVKSTRVDERTIGRRERIENTLLDMAGKLRSRLGLSADEKLKQRFIAAGVREDNKMEGYFAARLLGPIAGLLVGSLFRGNPVVWCLCLAAAGYMLPDLWLAKLIARRKAKIEKSIPDALDLMVICVDAGLGLDQALLRVGTELALSQPPISEEFLRVNLEQRAGKPRLDAWKSMADRTRIPEFAALVNMLTQTDRFGTPIIRALSRFAEEIRTKRRQRAEEEAAKTKVKILFPLVLFIFPSIFIVLLGPAVLNIMKTFAEMK